MSNTNLENASGFSREEKQLLLLLLIYAVGLTICRALGGPDRSAMALLDMVSILDWKIYDKKLFQTSLSWFYDKNMFMSLLRAVRPQAIPYLMIPFIGLFWVLITRSRTSLFFVSMISGLVIYDHAIACVVLPILFWGGLMFGGAPLLPLFALAFGLALGFTLLSRKICRLAHKIEEQSVKTPFRPGVALVVLALCFISPFVNQELILKTVRSMKSTEKVTLLKTGSDIYFMDGSPDGKMLALAAEDGVSVWDADSRECIWSDDTVVAQRVRFSPSGKYLAAAGRGMPDGASDMAVFEVDGFKRLPAIDWPEEEQRKEKIFHDLVFRPDEKSLLVAWHRDWDWRQIPEGFSGKEARALRRKDDEEIRKRYPPIGHTSRVQELFCTELNLESKNVREPKPINALSVTADLLQDGAVYFSPDASFLLYPRWEREDSSTSRRARLVDTSTWAEEEILLDQKYSMLLGIIKNWHEWQFTRNGKTAYLLALKDFGSISTLLKIDMETKQTQELLEIQAKPPKRYRWSRLALSPDESKVALLGFGEIADYRVTGGRTIATLRFWDLKTNATKVFVYEYKAPRQYGSTRGLVWLSQETLAVSMWERNGFFFINIKEEE